MWWEAREGQRVSSDKDGGAVYGKKERTSDIGDVRAQGPWTCGVSKSVASARVPKSAHALWM